MSEVDKQKRERVSQRVKELRQKAATPAEKTISRRTSSVSDFSPISSGTATPTQSIDSAYPAVIATDPLSKLSKKYGSSKRNSLLRWCQEQLGPGNWLLTFQKKGSFYRILSSSKKIIKTYI